MRTPPPSHEHIQGWGADLDHANRPAYPKERTPPRLEGVHWDQPSPQPRTVEVLKSVEHPVMTPVFGTTVPPKGLSGQMRRFAFRFSEGDMRHWLILLAADRVNMVEGLIDDFSRGTPPNVFKEVGGPAAIKHNPVGTARKALVFGALLGAGYLMLTRDSRRERQRERPAARLERPRRRR
ncbi:hypothetical protein HQN59_08645 [Schlegelella sp. ID0723]|uniref:Uncharacterized protein n=2 Tax=Piscinibacter koreensis TaxID=2742824 RepID=A0A7Y6NMH5_9BURK|nr:hypothetical protein [Schlegelella koreensis]